MGFTTVREYLVWYLRIDVVLLHFAMLKYFSQLQRMTNVHPLGVNKFTLPSLSFYLAQRKLMLQKRIAA